MEYPILEVPIIGGSILIAMVAIVHVFIAHFAVGAGLFTAVHEWRAGRTGDESMLRFLRKHSRFLILYSFIAGAATGVGIWWTIALVAPRVTSNLIHLFLWAWAAEWCLFIIEIAAGYVYYYTWDRLSRAAHVAVAVVYAVAAFGSLVLINGIISFMLTPGRFAGPQDFWANLFNPSFWPSTFVRTISAMALVALMAIVIVNYSSGFTREERHNVIRQASRWLLPLVLMVPLAWWYFAVVPPMSRGFVFEWSTMAMVLLFTFGVVASILIAAYAWFAMWRARRYVSGETGLLLLAIAMIATGSMEFVREGIRKPFLIHGHIYSTELTPSELRTTEREGTLAQAKWFPQAEGAWPIERGRDIFLIQCRSCHTTTGVYNPVAPLVKGYTDLQYEATLLNLHATKEAMPHYQPTPADREALIAYLKTLNAAAATTRTDRP